MEVKEEMNQRLEEEKVLQQEKIEGLTVELKGKESALDEVTAAKLELEEELRRLKNRNLFERIFKKGE